MTNGLIGDPQRRGKDHVKTETEVTMMQPPVEELSAATRSWNGFSLRAS